MRRSAWSALATYARVYPAPDLGRITPITWNGVRQGTIVLIGPEVHVAVCAHRACRATTARVAQRVTHMLAVDALRAHWLYDHDHAAGAAMSVRST